MKYFSVLFLFLLCFVIPAADIGERAPELNAEKWVRGEPVTLKTDNGSVNKDRIFVIYFWATWDSGTLHLLDFVDNKSRMYKNDNVIFAGISKEKINIIDKFLGKLGNLDINLAADNKSATYDKYMVGTRGVPMFFVIGNDRKLVWKGSPLEVDSIISKVLAGSFDGEKQSKIEKLRAEIRKVSLIFENDKVLKLTEEILKIDPTDETSINIMTSEYLKKKEYGKAIDFLNESKLKVHGNKYTMRFLYLYELEIIRLMNNRNSSKFLSDLLKNYLNSFNNSPDALDEIVNAVINDIPFEYWSPDELLKISRRAVELELHTNKMSESLGSKLETLAKTYYYIGKIQSAVITQTKANILLKDSEIKEHGRETLEFYKKILKLNIDNNAELIEKQCENTRDNLGKYLQTLGKVYYFTGQLKKAFSIQKKAVAMFRKKTEKEQGMDILRYYWKTLKAGIEASKNIPEKNN